MELRIRDAAKLFSVTEKKIRQWIEESGLPAQQIRGQYRLNRAELLEWATAHQVHISHEIFPDQQDGIALPRLSAALEAGGIFHGVTASDRESALRAVIRNMPIPDESDRDFLFDVLLAREAVGSTGIGDGIAIPHVRNPAVLRISRPIVNLCFLETPIDFGAIDGKPVFALFGLVSPTVRIHLHVLSRIAFMLHDAGFKSAVVRKASVTDILSEVRRMEGDIEKSSGGTSSQRQQ